MSEPQTAKVVRRPDARGWVVVTIGQLRDLLRRVEIPDDWEIYPNQAGNFLLFRPDPAHVRDYVGYIDIAKMAAYLAPDPASTPVEQRPGAFEPFPPFNPVEIIQHPNGRAFEPCRMWMPRVGQEDDERADVPLYRDPVTGDIWGPPR